MKYLLIILAFCFWILPEPSAGQDSFEGIIRYEISQSGSRSGGIPGNIEYQLKGENLVFKVFNQTGNELAWVLFIGEKKSAYLIDEVQKTALKIPLNESEGKFQGIVPDQYRENYEQALKDQERGQTPDGSLFYDTGEKEIIAGYTCKKFRLQHSDQDNLSETFIWVTGKIKFDLPRQWSIGENPLFLVLNKYGFPLKLVDIRGGNSIEMVATEIISKKLEDQQFSIPAGFSISDLSSLIK